MENSVARLSVEKIEPKAISFLLTHMNYTAYRALKITKLVVLELQSKGV